MRQIQVVDNWHTQPLNQRNDASVNPRPAVYLDSVYGPNAAYTDFIYKAAVDEGGALFSAQADPDIPTWARFFGANRLVRYIMPETLAQDEFDWKFTLNQGQIDLSMQANYRNGKGMIQWNPNVPDKWEDTGFAPLAAPPYGVVEHMARCSTDLSTWSLDLLACNGTPFVTTLRRVALKPTTWTKQKAHPQEQAEVSVSNNQPAYTIKRYLRTQLIMSDAPITLGWY